MKYSSTGIFWRGGRVANSVLASTVVKVSPMDVSTLNNSVPAVYFTKAIRYHFFLYSACKLHFCLVVTFLFTRVS